MTHSRVFAEIADIGKEFLSLSRSQQVLRDYSWQLGAICDLIRHTHSIVVRKLDMIEEATSPAKGKVLIGELAGSPLTDSFRANGLCDIFEGFGASLRKLTGKAPQAGGVTGELPISEARKTSWSYFCDQLVNREREVASLYADELQDLINLDSQMESPEDLDRLKSVARRARMILTSQMADFDALAKGFLQR